jgi:hypothetical protein
VAGAKERPDRDHRRMGQRRFLVGTAIAVLLTVAACGPDETTTSQSSTPSSTVTAATSAAQVATGSGVSPDQVCGLVTTAQMSQITGFTISSTRPETSGNVSVCHFIGTASDSTSPISKVIIQFQPDGKGAVEFTKSRGEVIPGLGAFAVYFSTAAQLSVELGSGDAVFHVYVEDVRANHNDPKGAATQIAQIAVPRLPH